MDESTRTSEERFDKTTITIAGDQIAYLDELSASIRRRSGAAVCRSALIRAIVRAFQACGVEFPTLTSEDEITRGLIKHLKSCRG